MHNKQCVRCNKLLINVHNLTKYCDECREIINKEKYKRHNKKVSDENKHSDGELRNNFFNFVKEPFHLTIKGFNEISKINTKSYIKFYKLDWFNILIKYNKSEELLNYIIKEYKNYINKTNLQGFKGFIEHHQYIGDRLIKSIGEDKIREKANIRKLRNTEDDYANNFYNIMKQIGRVPLFHEFNELTSIKHNTYANHLNLKGKIYDNIVKQYVNEEEFNDYLERKKLHKSQVGSETGKLAAIYSDQDYENEFKRVFEFCLKEYNQLPSRRLFNEISKFTTRTYTKKYKISWSDICKIYGYEIDRTANKSEKTSLEVVKSIIDENYIPQKTFSWLIGINNFKLYCDGYFPKHNLIIEFDGRQHREVVEVYGGEERFKVTVANDKIKDTLIPQHDLKLIRISSEEPYWNKEYIRNKLIQNNAI